MGGIGARQGIDLFLHRPRGVNMGMPAGLSARGTPGGFLVPRGLKPLVGVIGTRHGVGGKNATVSDDMHKACEMVCEKPLSGRREKRSGLG